MKNERQNTRDLETLSAYLDGELHPSHSQVLEARLQHEPNLQDCLENLRKTKRMLGYLPHLRAPHNYTLTPDMVTVYRQKRAPLFGALRLASALAAILLVALVSVELLFTSSLLRRPQLASEPMIEAAMLADEDEPEPLILWGVPGAGGYGGSDEPVVGYGGGGDATMREEPVCIESLPVEEQVPEFDLQTDAGQPDTGEMEMAPAESGSAKDLPILGINPEESGEIIQRSGDAQTAETAQPAWRMTLRWLQIALGGIAVGGGLAWWLLRRRG